MIKKKNKRAWIKILEAFLSILLILGVLSLMMTKDVVQKQEEVSRQIKIVENSILQKVQINDSLREEIFGISSIPLESGEALFPESLINVTNSSISSKLNCSMKVCYTEVECNLNFFPSNKEIYSSSTIIFASKYQYSPRQLSIFCWMN